MATLSEWLDGKTKDGVALPADKVAAYRSRRRSTIAPNATTAPADHQPPRPVKITIHVGGPKGGSPRAAQAAAEKPPEQPPTYATMAKSFAAAMAKHVASGGTLCTQEQIDARLAICATCPHLIGKRCNLCGCGCTRTKTFLNKLALPTSQCPDTPPRWEAIAAPE